MLIKTAKTLAALASLLLPETLRAESDSLSLAPSYLPNYVGIGVGAYPDYFGSDDQSFGAAPFGRFSWGERYVAFQATFVKANLLQHSNWRAGPTVFWRFGRSDVDDRAVDLLPDIDGSLELGGFVGYESVSPGDPRDRWGLSGGIAHDVSGVYNGITASASASKWIPATRFGALGFSLGATYGSSDFMDSRFSVDASGAAASGLDEFTAGSGVRDVRASIVYIQAISREWQIGGGLVYSRLLGDAADSPIVRDRGSRNQLYYGIGISRAF
ncbi:MltA-interacting protein MipA [Roseovarius gaetbuli]|uniref:MltA-interacting protein MipA n=2 Tax=Roseovarius gaetbuli TaxID=1356575 RepID=A0A1X6ZRP9_9RHOB|nr:MltA-interacting protein MipA [Roseovarius gaetbuli]